MNDKIYQIAKDNDCSIHIDKHGGIALLKRLYDDDGIKIVRFAPDPCDYFPVNAWANADAAGIQRMIA